MKFTSTILPTVLATTALAVPTQTLKARSTEICGQWDSVETGSYIVYQDLWGEDNASSGSQCTTVDSLSGTDLAWSTSWTWAGGSSDVKSYANVAIESIGKQISAVSSLKTTWKWRYVI
jgi:xyloglucan-specific endo-beta-1,4-glucanase